MSKKVTLLLGGSFNPIHKSGHIGSIQHVYHTLNLEGATVHEAWLMPAAHNPFKPKEGMADYIDRFNMCELEADKLPWLSTSAFESKIEPPHYTYRVLKELTEAYPNRQFIWMMGSDNLRHFHEWEHWDDMIRLLPLVIMAREGSMEQIMGSVTMREFGICQKDLSAPFRGGCDIRLMVTKCFPGAATEVRGAIKEGLPTPHLSHGVRDYIDQRDHLPYHR